MSDQLDGTNQAALLALMHLEDRALAATGPEALGFSITNEVLSLSEYRQAAFFSCTSTGKLRIASASGLVSVAEDSPYAVWLTRLAQTFPSQSRPERIDFSAITPEFLTGWQEWLPEHLVVTSLFDKNEKRIGLAMYARENPWSDTELSLLERLHRTHSYCLDALSRKHRPMGSLFGSGSLGGKFKWLAIAAALAMFLPVRLSVLAPAEVIALTAMAIAAPQDGVISSFHVQPNSPVKAGDKLFSLDDSALSSRREVARRGVSIARADLLVAQQRAFDDLKSKGELAAALGRVKEKDAELALVEGSLDRVVVKAERDGLAVFGDPNDWLGRPVQTGERVMQIADPRDAGVMVWLPVTDALNLEPGAPMRLFLHTAPLDPLPATLLQTSYQAVLSPEGVSAYRLRGQFSDGGAKARIGLRGTARVSGEWSMLGYYLFRRPISAVREWTGL